MEAWKPSLVVGIDFGMTCTAVAYSSDPEWIPRCIQRWPGRFHSSQLADKVPTQVGYDDDDRLLNWGFKCKYDNVDMRLEKEFKPYIDPSFTDSYEGRPSHHEATQFYEDYMKSLNDHLEIFFGQSIPDWHGRSVEFLFSIPTTWKNPRVTARIEQALNNAGFVNSHNRRSKVSSTEAEAAAVTAAKQYFKVGDIIMVVDAGGSTTDMNILEIKEHTSERTSLKALNKAEGINVGSTLIDWDMRNLIKRRLQALEIPGDEEHIHWTAEEMMEKGDFESHKCGFDWTSLQMYTDIHLNVPPEAVGPGQAGRNLKVIITPAELKGIFDIQLRRMFDVVRDQKRAFSEEMPGRSLRYIVLSGGLGSSAYVQRRMKSEFSDVQILCAPEPQLAVAKGLVMDRVQALRKGIGIYGGRCSRVSYGVLCRHPYDSNLHRGERTTKDPLDGMIWAEDQIDWLIREGEPVPDTGFDRAYRLKIPVGGERQGFKTHFVLSESPASNLPQSMRSENVVRLCTATAYFLDEEVRGISSNSSPTFKRVKGGFLSSKQEHYVAEFKLKIVVGSADLRFELMSRNGIKYNQNQAQVSVQWEEAVPKPMVDETERDIYPASSEKKKNRR